jgi:hypothetical protein
MATTQPRDALPRRVRVGPAKDPQAWRRYLEKHFFGPPPPPPPPPWQRHQLALAEALALALRSGRVHPEDFGQVRSWVSVLRRPRPADPSLVLEIPLFLAHVEAANPDHAADETPHVAA